MNEAVEALFCDDRELPEGAREALLALGPAMEGDLLAILHDESLYAEDARGSGFAPVHAIGLLGELRCARAIPKLIELMREPDEDLEVFDAAAQALVNMKALAVEPALAAYASTSDPAFRSDLASILSDLGVEDERIYEILVAHVDDDILGPASLGSYGDARALPLLSRRLDDCVPDDGDSNLVVELCAAIEELGAELTPSQREKRDQDRSRRLPGHENRHELADLLFMGGLVLPESARRKILALGPVIEPDLLAIMEDRGLYFEDSLGGGFAPLHAIELLGAMRSLGAIRRMRQIVLTCSEEEPAHAVASQALAKIFDVPLERLLDDYAHATEPRLAAELALHLAGRGEKSERIWDIVLEQASSVLGPAILVEYGDPRAIPVLSRAYDALLEEADDQLQPARVTALADAIEVLGGELTKSQRDKLGAWVRRSRWGAEPRKIPVTAAVVPGRNDPCSCGSGKKYKKCCG